VSGQEYDVGDPENVTASDRDLLSLRFEAERGRLRAMAFRMLGSSHEADDALQEAWMRLSRPDAEVVENLGGWLTTVVARICLDMLRAREAKREVPAQEAPDPVAAASPEDEALLTDSVGLAMLVVLDTLAPAERLAFVLHDMFAVPFEEIAPIVGRSPVATRQLASRARRRVQSDPAVPDVSAEVQREVVTAFLAASRQGDFAGLLRLLDPAVVLRADASAVDAAASRASAGAPALREQMRGADAVARVFAGRAQVARLTLIDGIAGAAWSVGGRPRSVFDFTVRGGRVVGIELIMDPETLDVLELEQVHD
jgi:RNA polymerase sigma factor (sigma-70 family)